MRGVAVSQLLFVGLLLAAAGCRHLPTRPPAETEVLVLADSLSGVPLARVPVWVDDSLVTTDLLGQVRVKIDSTHVAIRVFPYDPVSVPLQRGKRRRVTLGLPGGLLRYERTLLEAKRLGYVLVGVYDWWKKRAELAASHFVILRHDVDYDPTTARAMAFVEHLLGARSTFYFRWVTESTEAIDYVKAEGAEVGLHYETLAFYCEAHNITTAQQVTQAVLDTCRVLLRQEIARFESAHGDIHSIASHGAERNRQLGVPNAKLTAGQDLSWFGVEVDASLLEWHLPEFGLDVFVSDSGGHWDPFPLVEAWQRDLRHVYSLLHPCWWRPESWGPFVVVRP